MVPYAENLYAPEYFVDQAATFFLCERHVSLTCTALRVGHATSDDPGTATRVVVCRIVLPVVGAQELAVKLYNYLVANGVDPQPLPPKEQIQ